MLYNENVRKKKVFRLTWTPLILFSQEVDQERLDLYEKSLVAQTIAAFSAVTDDTKKTAKPQVSSKYQASESSSDIPDETLSAELLEARTNRDVVRERKCDEELVSPYIILSLHNNEEKWPGIVPWSTIKISELAVIETCENL